MYVMRLRCVHTQVVALSLVGCWHTVVTFGYVLVGDCLGSMAICKAVGLYLWYGVTGYGAIGIIILQIRFI